MKVINVLCTNKIVSDNKQFKCKGLCKVSDPVDLKCDKIPSRKRGQMIKFTVSVQFTLTRISKASKGKSKYKLKLLVLVISLIHLHHPLRLDSRDKQVYFRLNIISRINRFKKRNA